MQSAEIEWLLHQSLRPKMLHDLIQRVGIIVPQVRQVVPIRNSIWAARHVELAADNAFGTF